MVIGSSTSATQSGLQSAWQQMQVQQAQRNADQAEQNARALQAQAGEARRSANRAQETARSLEVQSGQAQVDADRAQQGVAAFRSEGKALSNLAGAYDKIVQAMHGTPAQQTQAPPQSAAPVVNVQGQTTGQLVNVTA